MISTGEAAFYELTKLERFKESRDTRTKGVSHRKVHAHIDKIHFNSFTAYLKRTLPNLSPPPNW